MLLLIFSSWRPLYFCHSFIEACLISRRNLHFYHRRLTTEETVHHKTQSSLAQKFFSMLAKHLTHILAISRCVVIVL